MDLLLDTNALLWALAGDARLGRATAVVSDRHNQVYVSAASGWEIAIKVSLGKLQVPPNLNTWLPSELATAQFTSLPVTLNHALEIENLPRHHADPFDCILIAQARLENLLIVTGDRQFAGYNVGLIEC